MTQAFISFDQYAAGAISSVASADLTVQALDAVNWNAQIVDLGGGDMAARIARTGSGNAVGIVAAHNFQVAAGVDVEVYAEFTLGTTWNTNVFAGGVLAASDNRVYGIRFSTDPGADNFRCGLVSAAGSNNTSIGSYVPKANPTAGVVICTRIGCYSRAGTQRVRGKLWLRDSESEPGWMWDAPEPTLNGTLVPSLYAFNGGDNPFTYLRGLGVGTAGDSALTAPPSGAIEAAAQAVASASAGLSTAIGLGANAASVASASAAVTAAIRLAATAVSNAAATGIMSAQIRLGADAAAQATATGSFGGAVLGAAATNVAMAIAALDTTIRLGGTAQSAASMNAALTPWASVTLAGVLYTGPGGVLDPNFWTSSVPGLGTPLYYDPAHIIIYPNGEISSDSNECTALVQFFDGVTWQLGLIILTPHMVAYARGAASASAQLTSAIELAAAASALATATAAFSTAASLGAQATVEASATADLATAIPFSALIASVVNATGALTTQIRLAATASADSTATANLNGVVSLNAAAQAISSSIAGLTTQTRLAAAAQGDADASAALATGIRMNAVAQSVVSAAGSLATSITLGGAAHSAVSSSANLSTARPLIAAAIDVATAVATLSTGIELRAAATAIAEASARLEGAVNLFADARAESTATAELTDVIATPPVGAYEIDPRYVIARPRWAFLPGSTPRFSRKDPSDGVVLTFDLATTLTANETLQGPITITVRTLAGSDASPGSLQRDVPSYDVARKRILLPVGGGLEGRWYYLKVSAATTNSRKTVSLAGLLPVME